MYINIYREKGIIMSRSSTGPSSSPSNFLISDEFSELGSFSISQTTNYPGSLTALQMICALDSSFIYLQKQTYSGVVTRMRIEKGYAECLLAEENCIRSQILRTNELSQAVKQKVLTFDEAMSIIATQNAMILFHDDMRLAFQAQLYNIAEQGVRMSCTFRHYRECQIGDTTKRYFSNEGINLTSSECNIFLNFLRKNFSNLNHDVEENGDDDDLPQN